MNLYIPSFLEVVFVLAAAVASGYLTLFFASMMDECGLPKAVVICVLLFSGLCYAGFSLSRALVGVSAGGAV